MSLAVSAPPPSACAGCCHLGAGVGQAVGGKGRLDAAALDVWWSDVLGRHVGYLPQDVELFAGTVAQNICRFDPDAISENIIAAAKEAGVHEMVVKMTEGYETQVGEQGVSLSAGQAQRVALARALYGEPCLIVLAGGFGGWGSTVQISGALIAPGAVVVDSNVKKVQHPTGGVVGEVRVRDGDLVKAGDIVVRLDDTVTKASLAIVVKTLNGLLAPAARPEAEPLRQSP